MKKTLTILSALALFGMLVAACGGGSKNDCEKAANVVIAGTDEACASKPNCCFCKCWKDGHKEVDNATSCTCKAPTSGGTTGDCSGAALTDAQQCLADEAACKASGAAIVQFGCMGT